MTLDTKLISEDGWSRVAKDHKLDRNRYSVALQKALTRYDETDDEKPGDATGKWKQASELLKQAPVIQATIAQLMKEKEVATSKDILKTLGEIRNYWAMKEKLLGACRT